MELFSTSGLWVEAFGKTLIHSIWTGLMLVALMNIALHVISHRRSHLRYFISVLTLMLYTGAVAAIFAMLYQPGPGSAGMPLSPSGAENTFRMLKFSQSGGQPVHQAFWTIFGYLYGTGVLIMGLRAVHASHHIHHLKVTGVPAGEPWNSQFIQLTGRLGIRQKVRLLVSEKISVPGLIGWIKPVVIVPAGMLGQVPMNQLETILMHELYHLKRYDFLVNAIQIILEGIFFYNPAIWLISRAIRIEREHCCDDLVVRNCQTPLLYARALFEISTRDHAAGRLVTAAGGPDSSGLSNRILRILKQKVMRTDIRGRLLSLTIFLAGIAIFLTINGFTSGAQGMKPVDFESGLLTGPFMVGAVPETTPEAETVQDPETVPPAVVRDTVPVPSDPGKQEGSGEALTDEEIDRIIEEAKESQREAMEEIDWEEIRESMEEARKEVLEEINWEELRQEMGEARKEVMEEIDWEAIKQEIEEARQEVMEEIDWDSMKEEIEKAQKEVMEEIDWDAMKQEIQESMEELREIDWENMKIEVEESIRDIDWEQMRKDLEESMDEIDFESFRIDIEGSMNDIDWGKIKIDLEQMRIDLDSIKSDFVWNPDQI